MGKAGPSERGGQRARPPRSVCSWDRRWPAALGAWVPQPAPHSSGRGRDARPACAGPRAGRDSCARDWRGRGGDALTEDVGVARTEFSGRQGTKEPWRHKGWRGPRCLRFGGARAQAGNACARGARVDEKLVGDRRSGPLGDPVGGRRVVLPWGGPRMRPCLRSGFPAPPSHALCFSPPLPLCPRSCHGALVSQVFIQSCSCS